MTGSAAVMEKNEETGGERRQGTKNEEMDGCKDGWMDGLQAMIDAEIK
jgi:hypothetical protein